MAKAKIIQNHFGGGRISPRSLGRTDLPQVQNGAEELINWIVMPDGSLTRRPGTRFVGYGMDRQSRAGGANAQLVPFVLDADDALMLDISALGPTSMRAMVDTDFDVLGLTNHFAGGHVSHAAAAGTFAAGSGTQQVFTLSSGSFANLFGTGTELPIVAFQGCDDEAINGWHRVISSTATTVTFDPGFASSVSTGSVVQAFELDAVAGVLNSSDANVQFAQSGNILYGTGPLTKPFKITRTTDTNWAIEQVDFDDGPWLPTNATATTLQPSAATGAGITITASAATFVAGDVGRLVRIKHGTQWGVAEITAFGSTTSVTADVEHDFGGTTAETNWRLQDWHDNTNYPHTVAFFEGRLVWGGGNLDPQRIVASNVDDFENMQPDDRGVGAAAVTIASHSYAYSAGSGDFSGFVWMVAHSAGLVCGTAGGIYIFSSENADGISATSTPRVRLETESRCAAIPPVIVDSDIYYVRRNRTELGIFRFDDSRKGYVTTNLNALASEFPNSDGNFTDGIERLTYTQVPYNCIWMVVNRRLVGMTILANDQVAWHHHDLGDDVVDVAAIPSHHNAFDTGVYAATPDADDFLFVKVMRSGVGIVERMRSNHTRDKKILLDSYISRVNSSTYSIDLPSAVTAKLYHLDGETVAIYHNAHSDGTAVVADGRVSLPHNIVNTGELIVIGLPTTATLTTMRLALGNRVGTVQANKARITKAFLRIFDTGALKAGKDASNLDEVILRDFGDETTDVNDADALDTLVTDDVEITLNTDFDRFGKMTIVADSPFRAAILALVLEVESNA
jgi:hypothetical protein